MKRIDLLIPTYNEEENVRPLVDNIIEVFKTVPKYDYRIVFIDNDSTDGTRNKIEAMIQEGKKVVAIYNAKNFGHIRSSFYGLTQCDGDAVVFMCADFQDPPEIIPQFIKEWEKGYKIVIGKKTKSEENKLMYFIRKCYYKGIKKIADIEHIEQFTGFGLYDKKFIEVLRDLDDSIPYLRGIVAELGFKRSEIEYNQHKRRYGKTKYNFYLLYDHAMLGITSYSRILLRLCTMIGFVLAMISFIIAIIYLIYKLLYWDLFTAGTAPILIGVFLFGSLQLFFTGLMGEYILNINTRVMHRPLVVEEKRLNFDTEKKGEE